MLMSCWFGFCAAMGWWRWALVSPDGVAPSWMVGLSASVNLPLHHKVQKFSSGTGSPGWSRKKVCKTVVVWHCKVDCLMKLWLLLNVVVVEREEDAGRAFEWDGVTAWWWRREGETVEQDQDQVWGNHRRSWRTPEEGTGSKLVSWSLTSLFSTNMAISATKEVSNCTRVCHSDVLYMISKLIPLLLQ